MNKDKMKINTGIGIPSMLIIFVILAMCVISLVSYLTAVNNKTAVEREYSYVLGYYKAEENNLYELSLSEGDMSVKSEIVNGTYLVCERVNGTINYSIVEE
ncbi:MAG: hypothetical protein Q4D13_07040 [Erysipelotrichaceae bacterium]|nr:hypothetical protein [Erysipelotrichaceae bacterium]